MWAIAKELKIAPQSLEELSRLPYTISYVLRKQIQLDSLNELPKDKKPPDRIVWWGIPEELDQWIEQVLDVQRSSFSNQITISESEIE